MCDQQSFWVQHMISVLVKPAVQTADRHWLNRIYASNAQQASCICAKRAQQARRVCNADLEQAGSEVWHTPLTIYHTPLTIVTTDALLTFWSQNTGQCQCAPHNHVGSGQTNDELQVVGAKHRVQCHGVLCDRHLLQATLSMAALGGSLGSLQQDIAIATLTLTAALSDARDGTVEMCSVCWAHAPCLVKLCTTVA